MGLRPLAHALFYHIMGALRPMPPAHACLPASLYLWALRCLLGREVILLGGLSAFATRGATMLYIGTSGYSYDDWVGPYYPEGIAKNEMLPFYAREFNTTEINYT